MKINTHIVLVGLLLGFVFSLFSQWSDSSFNDLNNYKGYRPNVIGEINAEFKEDLDFLVEESTNFRESVDGFVNQNQSKKNVEGGFMSGTSFYREIDPVFMVPAQVLKHFQKIIIKKY